MRERLIKLICQASNDECVTHCNLTGYCGKCKNAADYLIANGVIVPPCKVGDWLWYIYRGEINKAKVEEIRYDASKHGYYSYSFSIYAYDSKNKRQVTYYPIKSNINEVEGMDFDEDVFVFLTKEEAEAALRKEGAE